MARTNRIRKREKNSVPDYERLARISGRRVEAILFCDYEGIARISGRRVEAILFCAGQGRRKMTCALSSHLSCGVRVDELMMTMFSHQLVFLKSSPWSQSRLE